MDLRMGYKQTELGVFPDNWQVRPFAELFNFRNGVNADKYAYGAGIPFANVLEVITKSVLKAADIPGRVTLSPAIASLFAVSYGDLLFNRTSETPEEVGLTSVYLDECPVVFGGFVIRGRPSDDSLDPHYCAYGFRSPYIRSQLVARGQGAIRANIGQADLRTVRVVVPPIPEQRAIAMALSDVDALIGALDKLIAKKRDLKQAAMQQLLTGQTRLPGFSGEWPAIDFGDVLLGLEAGVSVNSVNSDSDADHGGPYVLKTSCVANGLFDCQEKKAIVPRDRSRARTNPARDSIIISRMNTPNLVGEIGYVAADHPELFLPDRLWITKFKAHAKLSVRWLAYLLSSKSYKRQVKEAATGTSGSMKNISKDSLLRLSIPFPSLNEQTAIATVLSDMDAEIAALEARRDKTRALKQGMMQELLTGRIRLV